MVSSCCAYNCTERYQTGKPISFFRFPIKNERLFRAWCIALRRKNFHPTWASRVCSKHFTEDCFEDSFKFRKLKSNAVPTIFDFGKTVRKKWTSKKALKSAAPLASEPSPCKEKNIVKNECENTRTAPKNIGTEIQAPQKTAKRVEIIKIEIVKLPRDVSKDSATEPSQEQSNVLQRSVNDSMAVSETLGDLKSSAPFQKQFEIMQNENEVLRQTVLDLSKKIERCQCITNVLRSHNLISEEAAAILKSILELENNSGDHTS